MSLTLYFLIIGTTYSHTNVLLPLSLVVLRVCRKLSALNKNLNPKPEFRAWKADYNAASAENGGVHPLKVAYDGNQQMPDWAGIMKSPTFAELKRLAPVQTYTSGGQQTHPLPKPVSVPPTITVVHTAAAASAPPLTMSGKNCTSAAFNKVFGKGSTQTPVAAKVALAGSDTAAGKGTNVDASPHGGSGRKTVRSGGKVGGSNAGTLATGRGEGRAAKRSKRTTRGSNSAQDGDSDE